MGGARIAIQAIKVAEVGSGLVRTSPHLNRERLRKTQGAPARGRNLHRPDLCDATRDLAEFSRRECANYSRMRIRA
jgi:hypothetical protein